MLRFIGFAQDLDSFPSCSWNPVLTAGYHVNSCEPPRLPVATARGICIRPQGICTVHRFLSSNHADHNRAVVLYDELVEIIEAPEKNFVLVDVREPHEVSEGKVSYSDATLIFMVFWNIRIHFASSDRILHCTSCTTRSGPVQNHQY